MLFLDLKSIMEGFEKMMPIVKAQQVHLDIKFEKAPMYNKMVEVMFPKTNLKDDTTLEGKWEAFKDTIVSCTKECFFIKNMSRKGTSNRCSPKKKWFDKECHEARKCLLCLDIVKGKQEYQMCLYDYKRRSERKRREWQVHQQLLHTRNKEKACHKF